MASGSPRLSKVAIASALSAALLFAGVVPAVAAEPDLAPFGSITASASQNDEDGNFPAENAIDGSATTRWASGNGPDSEEPFTATLTSDLGAVATVSGVTIAWEAAYATGYEVQVAQSAPDDAASWSTVASTTTGAGDTETVAFEAPTKARYVRLAMLQRLAFDWDPAGPHYYGYSVFTFGVNGTLPVPTVAFGSSAASAGAGADVVVPVLLSNASDTDQTVRVVSSGGTAIDGTDYTAVDEVLTFAAGETAAQVTVATSSQGALAPIVTFDLTLSEPSAGITLGTRSVQTVTLRPTGEVKNVGAAKTLNDFENGVPEGFFNWGSTDAVRPALTTAGDATVPGSTSNNQVLVATVGGEPTGTDWMGFSNDTAATDWSDYDGFRFRFLGTASGKTLSYEVKNGNVLFDQSVVDDSEGWRTISVLFSDLRVKNNPSDAARFDPGVSTGFAVTLTGLGAGTWAFDDVEIFERAIMLEDFEGDVPIGPGTDATGFFPWGSEDGSVTLGVTEQERADVTGNHVLSGTYQIESGGYGGFNDNLAVSQDWSSFAGIRFWWYASQPSNPASPTAGDDIRVEVKDGGPDAEHSELWATTFKDNWGSSTSRWKLVELPFSSFTIGAYQPGSTETQNGTLDLTSAWGFAPTLTPGKPTSTGWAIDDVQLYGTPAATATTTLTTDQDVYLVDQGDTATIGLTISTASGDPLETPVTVRYRTGEGSAVVGTNVTEVSGEVTFDAGTASGATETVDVATLTVRGGDRARDVPILLEADGATVPADAPRVVINAHGLPYLDSALPTAQRVDDLLSRMTLAEKVGQMAMAERLGLSSPAQIADLQLGSLLSGGGSTPGANTPEDWADMIDGFQRQALSTSLQIPLLYGADAVHGHSNVLDATIFPHNTSLGATRDPALVQQVAEVTAKETKATGVNWTFAPCLCVTRDERWGRSYESFGEDPALVSAFAGPTIIGLQGSDPSDLSGPSKVLGTAKHWVGDGGTAYDASKAGSGYPIDQGLTTVGSLDELDRLHIDPFRPAIAAGVGSVMPSYSGVDLGDGKGDVRMHENTLLNTTVLKGDLDFRGFMISDWEGIDKLPGGTYTDKVARSINSGVDIAMAPYNFGAFVTSLTENVGNKTVKQSRVDDAVRRILTQKFALGLFENALADRSGQAQFGSAEHRAVARTAVAESQVLLKNDGALPLSASDRLYVAGSNADDLGHQTGGWTISWQGGSGDTTTGTSILEGITKVDPDAEFSADASAPLEGYDKGVVVVGEAPYAEGQGDVGNNGKSLSLSKGDRAAIDRVCGAMECVVLVVAGRTQLVTDQLDEMNALVSSFLPGSEGDGVADVLFGSAPFTGRLPVSWPKSADQVPVNVGDSSYDPLYSYGWGLRTDSAQKRLTELASTASDPAVASAAEAIVASDIWNADGSVRDARTAFRLVTAAVASTTGTEQAALTDADTLVSVLRDIAQAAVVSGTAAEGSSALTADAEHALLSGDPVKAADLLAQVAGTKDARVVLDDFDRGDGAVGGSWGVATATYLYRVKDKALDAGFGGPLVWRGHFGTSQEASVVLATIDPTSRAQGLILKASSPSVFGTSGIRVSYDARAKGIRVSTSRGLFTNHDYGRVAAPFSDGDLLTARALPNGTVEVLRNAETVATIPLNSVDRAWFAGKRGSIGIWSLGARNAIFDDFGGGTLQQ